MLLWLRLFSIVLFRHFFPAPSHLHSLVHGAVPSEERHHVNRPLAGQVHAGDQLCSMHGTLHNVPYRTVRYVSNGHEDNAFVPMKALSIRVSLPEPWERTHTARTVKQAHDQPEPIVAAVERATVRNCNLTLHMPRRWY